MDSRKIYYVYEIYWQYLALDIVVKVGKGSGDRASISLEGAKRELIMAGSIDLAHALKSRIVLSNLSESEAFKEERNRKTRYTTLLFG